MSSGELAREHIIALMASGALAPKDEIAVFARGGDMGPLDGIDLTLAPPGQDTALLAILGVEPETVSRDRYLELMAPLAARGAPALCANPDLVMYDAKGASRFAAGAVAAEYEKLGGSVCYLGKPARAMFDRALAALGAPAAEDVLMIGDSPEHDLAGAAAVGCKTLFARSGVQSAVNGRGAEADYAIDLLRW